MNINVNENFPVNKTLVNVYKANLKKKIEKNKNNSDWPSCSVSYEEWFDLDLWKIQKSRIEDMKLNSVLPTLYNIYPEYGYKELPKQFRQWNDAIICLINHIA